MRREVLLCIMLAAAPLPAFAQGTASAPLAGKLPITGSSTMAPIGREAGQTRSRAVPRRRDHRRDGRLGARDTWLLLRPLNLLTRRALAGAAKAFIEFALSPAAREVILEHDFAPYSNEPRMTPISAGAA